jgi:sec-independent protein translocase protein TatC
VSDTDKAKSAAPEKGTSKAPEDDEIEASRAPLLTHLIELRSRLIRTMIAIFIAFILCFAVANHIYNILVIPYEWAAGEGRDIRLIYTAPQEFFITQLKLALFGAIFIAFPVIAVEVYRFVAPGLYKNERGAFIPYLVATPILFVIGAAVVFFVMMPLALRFFLSLEQPGGDGQVAIELLPKVDEYLSLIMALILAFGLVFQLPVVLTLLARAGIMSSDQMKKGRRYAIVLAFVAAAILTPPDIISQFALAVPTILLFELSIYTVRWVERRQAAKLAAEQAAEAAAEAAEAAAATTETGKPG